ncbi:glycosyltransferase family 4 protein [Paractinoplanes ferrugineus]|uniref:Glycosyl transferase family 1 n=1 Tax=Paractinoplanes ferrugineus TaxID=113564 RepID=A0A919JBB6_9ACTN|nr:glycosyltransferase [Actinoplanes ferrugineus]GIE16149.1 glycosyl transferase family 1 [Actinoplanes ferrugineus]
MKVLFLINDAFGIGGTIKTSFNLGAALAARGHEIEVLSTVRRRDVPQLPVDPAIRLMSLVDIRKDHPDHVADAPGRGKPGRVYPRADFKAADYDRHVERLHREHLRSTDADVVIATRPGLIAYAAKFAPKHLVRIGQEHLTRDQHRQALRDRMPRYLRKLDAFVTVSQRDADDYAAHLRLRRTRLLFVPNGIPAPTVPPSHGRAKLVVAAGRLVPSKRYDVLVRAFAKVVAERPDWQLRIYGDGREMPALRALVLELGLHNHVRMMGNYAPIETEWAKGSIAAVSADREPFGMTLVEAMRCGVPVVSTDAPYGPGEILRHGADGLLTPVGDPDAMGAALLQVINDDELRRSMAAAALANSARYDPAPIAEQYERLFLELAAGKRPPRRPRTPVATLGPAPSVGEPTLDWDGVGPLPAGTTISFDKSGVGRVLAADGTAPLAGVRDTRGLLDGPLGQRIQLPFRAADGTLGVRVWDQPVYAEVGDVSADTDGIHLTGRLFGAMFDSATLRAHRGDESRELTVTTDGPEFQASIPALPAGTWALRLCHAAGATPVTLGRFRDDIVDKRTAFVLPAAVVGGVRLQPTYTESNEFVIRATA